MALCTHHETQGCPDLKQILCVCLGNICRSPTAEAVLRAKANGYLQVDSAGTSNWHIGNAPYPPAIAAGSARGYDLTPLRARQFHAHDFDKFDIILAMDANNLADIERMRPTGNDTRVCLMMDFAPSAGINEVPDPYYTRNFEEALDLIESAADGLLKELGYLPQ